MWIITNFQYTIVKKKACILGHKQGNSTWNNTKQQTYNIKRIRNNEGNHLPIKEAAIDIRKFIYADHAKKNNAILVIGMKAQNY